MGLWDSFYAVLQDDCDFCPWVLPFHGHCIITGPVTCITANIRNGALALPLPTASDSMAMGDDSHFGVTAPHPSPSGIQKPGMISQAPNRNNMGALCGMGGLRAISSLPPLSLKYLMKTYLRFFRRPQQQWASACRGRDLHQKCDHHPN